MNTSNFQLIFLGAFVLLLFIGVGVFAKFGGAGGNTSIGTVTIWGTLDQGAMNRVLLDLRTTDSSFQSVTYIQQDPTTYTSTLINAMATGGGPDLFVVSQDNAVAMADKITTIPYANISQQSYTTSFIDEGQLFLTGQGTLALPILVDPLVMYWNRDLFSSAGEANPPLYWNAFLNLAPKMTKLVGSADIQRSTVALGGWGNIPTAKEVLSSLFMQAGDGVIVRDAQGAPSVVFGQNVSGSVENPAASALRFYTEFINPSKTTYSWNRSLPQAPAAFAAGNLAVLFDFASTYPDLANRNPNLRFGVAALPQIQGAATRVTYGRMHGLAISRMSKNPNGALTIAQKLSSVAGVTEIMNTFGLPSVRRDIPVDTSASASNAVFADSALIARAWLDPDPTATSGIFGDMVESVVRGEDQPDIAVLGASQALSTLVQKYVRQQ